MIGHVPPSFWKKQFDASAAQVVEFFEKYAASMVGALGTAVTVFDEQDWMTYFLNQENKFYCDFVNFLPISERDKYLLRIFSQEPKDVIHHALRCTYEWGMELAASLIREMANHPYEYNRAFFSKHIQLIPVGIINQIEKAEPKDVNLKNAWEKSKHHLIKLLSLKQQTLRAFNA